MSCSKDSTIVHMLRKGFIKPNLDVLGRNVSSNLYNYLDKLTKLAKNKYEVDMGPLFSVGKRYSEDPLGPKFQTSYLIPNDYAFEAIDRSSQADRNRELEQTRLENYHIYKDYLTLSRESNYEVEEGEVIIPKNLPAIKIKCR